MSRPIVCVKEGDDGGFIRRCHKCGEWKKQNLENFYVMRSSGERSRTHMFHPQCRECSKLIQREFRKLDPKKQAKATRSSRDRMRERRYQAYDIIDKIQSFLSALPTYASLSDACEPARILKRSVDIYVIAEEKYVERSKSMIKARVDGQITKCD